MTRFSYKLALLPAILLFATSGLFAQESSFRHFYSFSNDNPCKPFIGVGTSSVAEGLKVDYTVENTPATQYGVQTGDVILALDGVPVRTQAELLRERDKHQQGDAFTLTLIREGRQKSIQARFKACTEAEEKAAEEKMANFYKEQEVKMADLQALAMENWNGLEKSQRPILGVYENTEADANGLVIEQVIPGKGAAEAGLKEGDVVVKVDGKPVTGALSLRGVLDGHKAGDAVVVVYERNGKTMQTKTILSTDQYSFNMRVERDPCQVFIGVYTSAYALNGKGTRVDGVIDDTPAKEAGIQPGDVIMALNGVPVNTYDELTRERNKNNPGDAFRLSVSRNGVMMEVKARFKSCDQKQTEVAPDPVEQREAPKDVDNSLKMEVLEAFPNPTYGLVNVHFEAEAVPTTVQITDISGKVVYSKNLPKFDGSFDEQVNLSNQNAGNYVLSIRQGEQVRSKQIVLLPRA